MQVGGEGLRSQSGQLLESQSGQLMEAKVTKWSTIWRLHLACRCGQTTRTVSTPRSGAWRTPGHLQGNGGHLQGNGGHSGTFLPWLLP